MRSTCPARRWRRWKRRHVVLGVSFQSLSPQASSMSPSSCTLYLDSDDLREPSLAIERIFFSRGCGSYLTRRPRTPRTVVLDKWCCTLDHFIVFSKRHAPRILAPSLRTHIKKSRPHHHIRANHHTAGCQDDYEVDICKPLGTCRVARNILTSTLAATEQSVRPFFREHLWTSIASR